MFKGPGKIVRDNKSSSYPVFELTGVNCIYETKRRYAYCPWWKAFILVEDFLFSGSHSFQPKPFLSVVSAPFQFKLLLLAEIIHLRGSHSFQRKSFLLMKAITFSRSYSFQWKPFVLVEAISFSGSHSFYWKPLLLVETNSFSGSHSLQ